MNPQFDWPVKIWHFNRDSANGYGGPKFQMYWKDALGGLSCLLKKSNKI
jgi:hypothetical protein